MTVIQISRADIDDLAEKVNRLDLSPQPQALMHAIFAAIRAVADDQQTEVTVTVDTAVPLQGGFDTAYTPDQAQDAAAAQGVQMTVTKIGKGP